MNFIFNRFSFCNRINNINTMITNKTFYGVNLPKKGLGISPLK
jgi:hypothetical protein